MKKVLLVFVLSLAMLFNACIRQNKSEIQIGEFGILPDGRRAMLYTLINGNGLKVQITNYGAKLVSLAVPDRNGKLEDVILGYDIFEDYFKGDKYHGATVGRFANRIAKGQFSIDGKNYTLALNNGPNHLHGGSMGFHSVLWIPDVIKKDGYSALRLTYHSPDGDEGYPGSLDAEVVYTWKDDNSLCIDYTAKTDKATIVNLSHHSLFNLKGAGHGDILGHFLTIPASKFTPVDSTLIPTGEIRPVINTPMNFITPLPIGQRIDNDYEQLEKGNGYDHNWVLDKGKEVGLAARLYEPESGRVLEVYSDQPGLQFYSGNFFDGSQIGKGGRNYIYRGGLALETQHFPDSPNHSSFPSVIVKPGDLYIHKVVYRFSVIKE